MLAGRFRLVRVAELLENTLPDVRVAAVTSPSTTPSWSSPSIALVDMHPH